MADFEITMLGSSEVGISALSERAQKERRLKAGYTLVFKGPGDALPYVKAAASEGFTFKGIELIGR